MKIAIIGGTGEIGKGFAVLATKGFDVYIGSREIEKAKAAVVEYLQKFRKFPLSGSISGCTNEEAVEKADIIVLAIKYEHVKTTIEKTIIPHLNKEKNQVVLSLVVPMKGLKYDPPESGSAALEIKSMFPELNVVAGFHTVPARKFALTLTGKPLDMDTYIFGDNLETKRIIIEMAEKIPGLRVLDGGLLKNSSDGEQLASFLIRMAKRNGLEDLGIKCV